MGTQAARPRRPELPWWRKLWKEWAGRLGLTLAAAAIIIGYMGRDSRRLFAEQGLGYALGIVGSLLILTLLLYPLRKRYKILKILGNVRNWFQVHMILGVVGPLAVLYHANFSLGSVNSTAALVSMLLVAGSGLIGRFLYAKIHHGLYGRKKSLQELLSGVKLSTAETGGAAQFVPDLMKMVAEFDRQVLKPPKNIWHCMILPLRLMFQTRAGYRRIVRAVRQQLDAQAVASPVVAQHRDRLLKATARFVREHLRRVRQVAAFVAYDRLFALWHKVHLPFFYLLLLTAIVHVIAVHAYSI
ncbi:MAG: hypothetical protein QNJ00_06360 [Woeseiaceae bacterium]|nr:hypothetical protein [Woeseiaceae bacterium]